MKSCWTDCCEIFVNMCKYTSGFIFLTVVWRVAATVTTNSGMHSYVVYLEKHAMLIRHGFSFFYHGKVMEGHCWERMGSLLKLLLGEPAWRKVSLGTCRLNKSETVVVVVTVYGHVVIICLSDASVLLVEWMAGNAGSLLTVIQHSLLVGFKLIDGKCTVSWWVSKNMLAFAENSWIEFWKFMAFIGPVGHYFKVLSNY